MNQGQELQATLTDDQLARNQIGKSICSKAKKEFCAAKGYTVPFILNRGIGGGGGRIFFLIT